MKKRDILLAGGIVLMALVMLLVMHVTGETKGDQVQITVNGEIYARSRAGSAVRNRPSYVCPINWWWK